MCLLVAYPGSKKAEPIQKAFLLNGFRENPDGAGFVYVEKEKLVIEKGFTNFSDFWKSYRKHNDAPALIHFRKASVGPVNKANCHPFLVDNKLAFAHNGTINILPIKGSSDTVTFNKQILRFFRTITYNFLDFGEIRWLLSQSIGKSKLAFITPRGKITIINKSLGVTKNNVWYSNTSFLAFPQKISTTPSAKIQKILLTQNLKK